MEIIQVLVDADIFDEVVHNSLKDDGRLRIIIKPNATTAGNPGVVLTFNVELPDGTAGRVQTVNTLNNLRQVLKVLDRLFL